MGGNSTAGPKGAPRDAREIERRNRAALGKPLSPIMKTAATARELAQANDKSPRGE
jgi:hypothetical protein